MTTAILGQAGQPLNPVITWAAVVALAVGLLWIGNAIWDYWDHRRGRRRGGDTRFLGDDRPRERK